MNVTRTQTDASTVDRLRNRFKYLAMFLLFAVPCRRVPSPPPGEKLYYLPFPTVLPLRPKCAGIHHFLGNIPRRRRYCLILPRRFWLSYFSWPLAPSRFHLQICEKHGLILTKLCCHFHVNTDSVCTFTIHIPHFWSYGSLLAGVPILRRLRF